MSKFKFTRKELQWLERNLHKLTTAALCTHIMLNRPKSKRAKYTTFRTALYEKDLKKCSMLRWTDKETRFLLDNYKTMGNIEIAEKLTKGKRVFKKKNVEKKMVLLDLRRTEAERMAIIDRHRKKGTYRKANLERWEKMKIQEGNRTIQLINGRPSIMVKVNGILKRYARHRYQELHGKIASSMKVYHKDMNPLNVDDDNLIARKETLNKEERELFNKNCQKFFEKKRLQESSSPAPKPEPVPAEDNTKGKIAVRVNRRTVLYVAPGTNIENLKAQYNQIHA